MGEGLPPAAGAPVPRGMARGSGRRARLRAATTGPAAAPPAERGSLAGRVRRWRGSPGGLGAPRIHRWRREAPRLASFEIR